MDTEAEKQAIASFERWAQAFNERDADGMVAEMHFPHMRLANNKFHVWEKPVDFHGPQPKMTEQLIAEGWARTVTKSITAVQSSPEKVHLAIRQSRQHKDGSEYNGFDTLWVFTKLDGNWGVQFRSSFLANVVQAIGASDPGCSG